MRFAFTTVGLVCGLVACADTVGVTPPRDVHLQIEDGDGQEAQVGANLSDALQVRASDSAGVAQAGVPVTWHVVDGGGNVDAGGTVTDSNGIAETDWVLGPELGAQSVQATTSTDTVHFEAWAAPAPPSDWNDVLKLRATLTVDGEQVHVAAWVDNLWAGTVTVRTNVGCLTDAHLLDSTGTAVRSMGTGCTYWVDFHTFSPMETRQVADWSFSTSGLEPGEYLVRMALWEGHRVNGDDVVITPVEIRVTVD